MVLDATLINTQHHKVWIKGKVEKSRERSNAFPLHLGVVANEKGAFGSPSTMICKTQKIVLDATLLNSQHYKVKIRGKVEQSGERSSTLPYTSV